MRHEEWIAEDLREHGWEASDSHYCSPCERGGSHVELDFPAYRLIGHFDRIIFSLDIPTGKSLRNPHVGEFKALSRDRAAKLVRAINTGHFSTDFHEYAFQISCYHHATHWPILYAVKSRDTGKLDVFEIRPPLSLEEIDDHVLSLEIQARKEILPKCRYERGDFERTICAVKYMCAGEDEL